MMIALVVILQVFAWYKQRSISSSIIKEIVVEVTVKKTNDEFAIVCRQCEQNTLISSIFAMSPFLFSGNVVVSNVYTYVSCQFILTSHSHLCLAIKCYLYVQE